MTESVPPHSFAETLRQMMAGIEDCEPGMSLSVCEDSKSVTLVLDNSIPTYAEWIKNEGADIALYRCQDTNRVVGVRLPLLQHNLCVFHEGPLRINSGFYKDDQKDTK